MGKAEKFIQEHTNGCSNQLEWSMKTQDKEVSYFHPWLTPDQARKAVEIAREETYEWLRVNLCNYFDDTGETFDKCINDLKQAIKDE